MQKIIFVLFLSFVLTQSTVFAGAWAQKKKGYYLKFSANYLLSNREFNHEGDELEIFEEQLAFIDASFQDFNITAYFEYGLFDRLTLIGNIPFKILTSKRSEVIGGDQISRILTLYTVGFSDFTLSGKYAFFNGSFALSLQGGIKIPLFYEPQPTNDGAPLGTADADIEGFILLGKSLYPLPVYITGGFGYRYRDGPLHDQILFNLEAGFAIDRFLLKVVFDGLQSTVTPPDIFGQEVVTPLPGGGGVLPNIIVGDQDIFKISPSLIYNAADWLSFQGEILHTIAGKNTVAGTVYSFGVVFFQ